MIRKRTNCRACGSANLEVFLRLGPTPLANSFLDSPDALEPSFPLDVYFCGGCSLVQLLDVVDAETLFRNYVYVSGTSETMRSHFREYAKHVAETLGLGSDDLVVEVASNDGSLLECFRPYGVRSLGIEPARNIADIARAKGIDTIAEFFTSSVAKQVRSEYGSARAVIGNNVLAHVDDTRDFLVGCAALIGDDGMVVVEVPYLRPMLDRLEYDTVYHEHLCYFSVTALLPLFESAGLRIARILQTPIHGGSLRVYGGQHRKYSEHSIEARRLVEEERALGMHSIERYREFARQVGENRQTLVGFLESLKRGARTVAGYGAPAKGNTLLNYCRISTDLLPYTVDRNPMKVSKFTPGMHIPVLDPSVLAERKPDFLLILPWNIADEIVEQQVAFRRAGGRFILPVPRASVI
jgi:hypothetical protein